MKVCMIGLTLKKAAVVTNPQQKQTTSEAYLGPRHFPLTPKSSDIGTTGSDAHVPSSWQLKLP
eukprot:98422-Amphidinium_carterae.1